MKMLKSFKMKRKKKMVRFHKKNNEKKWKSERHNGREADGNEKEKEKGGATRGRPRRSPILLLLSPKHA